MLLYPGWRPRKLANSMGVGLPNMLTSLRTIHGFVALKTLWCWARWVDPNNSHGKMATCPDCKRRWKNVPEDPPAGEAADRSEHYSLLGDEGVDHEDVEATASS